MATKLNYDDYTHDFMGKVGNVEDFSREFLVGLVRVFEDTQLFAYQAWATAYGARVGFHEAWDMAGEISRNIGRQIMPMARYVAKAGSDWKLPEHHVQPFDCVADDLTKQGLIRLIRTYWDQWLKFGMAWVQCIIAAKRISAPDAAGIAEDAYKAICAYEIPKLAKLCRIEPRHVIDYIKLANIGIDGTRGYQGEWEVVDPDHVVFRVYQCEVLEKYMDEGVFDAKKARWMCRNEEMISRAFFPGIKLDIELPPDNLKIPQGEPFCVWTYTKKGE